MDQLNLENSIDRRFLTKAHIPRIIVECIRLAVEWSS